MPALYGPGVLLVFLGCPFKALQAHGPRARCQSQLDPMSKTFAEPGLLMLHVDVELRLRARVFVPPEVEELVKTLQRRGSVSRLRP